jgi:ABC-type Zn uptake system ZnuABC Zn-binding protein ZnuA
MLVAGVAGFALPRRAFAATVIVVPNNAIGAIVAATGKDRVSVQIDATLADDEITIDGAAAVKISQRILRKGEGVARSRFLDDARNATKIGGNIKTALTDALPNLADDFDANHRAWAKPFAAQANAWTKQLAKLGLRNIRDDHGRVYLLEWAGATIDPKGVAGPRGLARAPAQPSKPTLDAYQDYIGDLVAALS